MDDEGEAEANFTRIQDAVDNATAGDTIIVSDGTYIENVNVYVENLTISSVNGSDFTIIQAANSSDHVFEVTADYVNISGFTVRGATEFLQAGIYLNYIDHCTVSNNICSNNHNGIYLRDSSNNTINGNNVSNNNRYGIYPWNSNDNQIFINNFINNSDNALSKESTNIWNSPELNYTYNGSTSTNYLGNYWDDYEVNYPDAEEIDATGIWNTPYEIDGDSDNYPLMEPFENYIT